MKKFVIFVIFILMSVGSQVMADPNHPQLNWGGQVNASQCSHSGAPVINVTQKVANDVDSGTAGNYWAFDNFNRHIQVWAQDDGSYCAIIQTEGSFDAQAGQRSPGNGGFLNGSEDGTFQGGYHLTIQGTLSSSPAWARRGNLGTVDYQCDLSGNCPGYVSWLGQYFNAGYSYTYEWWGWVYNAGANGTWVNAADGNSGDILSP